MRGLWWRTLARINHRGMIDESCCVEEGLGARLGTPTDLMMVRSSTTVPAEHGACARGLDEKSANKQYRHLEYNTWLNKGVIHKGNWLVNKLLRIVDRNCGQFCKLNCKETDQKLKFAWQIKPLDAGRREVVATVIITYVCGFRIFAMTYFRDPDNYFT